MVNNLIFMDKNGDIEKIYEHLYTLENHKEVKSILILAADGSSEIKEQLNHHLKKIKKNIFGGFFPKIINNENTYDKGCLLVGLTFDVQTHLVNNISKSIESIDSQLEAINSKLNNPSSFFVYVDGLSSGISSFIESVYNNLGMNYKYIGGGAGSLSFEKSPCIITNKGISQDTALLVETKLNLGVGVAHGWQKLAGPYRVTESQQNKIISLDWEPAFEVYKSVIEKESNKKFTESNFFDIAKCFPFGINKLNSEVIVRDPIIAENNQLICVGEVPENEYVNILVGTESSLINAAAEAEKMASEKLNRVCDSQPVVLMDCISRALFLNQNFNKELKAIKNNNATLVGALCLGEIANSGDSSLDFFNKTCVVGKIGENT